MGNSKLTYLIEAFKALKPNEQKVIANTLKEQINILSKKKVKDKYNE